MSIVCSKKFAGLKSIYTWSQNMKKIRNFPILLTGNWHTSSSYRLVITNFSQFTFPMIVTGHKGPNWQMSPKKKKEDIN